MRILTKQLLSNPSLFHSQKGTCRSSTSKNLFLLYYIQSTLLNKAYINFLPQSTCKSKRCAVQ
jgi:hypothetical protein